MMQFRFKCSLIMLLGLLIAVGCAPRISLFPDACEPLEARVLQGTAKEKILMVPISGIISDMPRKGTFFAKPSMVQEVVSHLNLAEKDDDIRAVILKIDSPGGSATASDLLYHEVAGFKKRTGKKVISALMNLATSGGYYISLPADHILAHPTTLTGSVGVILVRPQFVGLMEKIGVSVEINKSGKNKDMGSPFRETTEEEYRILQDVTQTLGKRFVRLVSEHRHLKQDTLEKLASARVYMAGQAKEMGLIDAVGYLEDAISTAKSLSGLPEKTRVVVYRRSRNPNDNLYNTATLKTDGTGDFLGDIVPDTIASLPAGFYYLWPAAVGNR